MWDIYYEYKLPWVLKKHSESIKKMDHKEPDVCVEFNSNKKEKKSISHYRMHDQRVRASTFANVVEEISQHPALSVEELPRVRMRLARFGASTFW